MRRATSRAREDQRRSRGPRRRTGAPEGRQLPRVGGRPVTSAAGQCSVATRPSPWSSSGRSRLMPPVDRRASRSARRGGDAPPKALRQAPPARRPSRDPRRRPRRQGAVGLQPAAHLDPAPPATPPPPRRSARRRGAAARGPPTPASVAAGGGDGDPGGLVHQRHGVAQHRGTVCGAPRCTPGSAPQSSSSASLSRRRRRVTSRSSDDPRAVVGELSEDGDAVQKRLLAVDPVLQTAGQVGHGPVVAGVASGPLPSVGPRSPDEGPAAKPAHGSVRPSRSRPPSWARRRTSCQPRSVLPNGSMCSRRSCTEYGHPYGTVLLRQAHYRASRTAQQGCTSTAGRGPPQAPVRVTYPLVVTLSANSDHPQQFERPRIGVAAEVPIEPR